MAAHRFPTDDAVKLFFPGQRVSLKPLDDRPGVSFTICKLSMPVTASIVVLAKPDAGNEHLVIKIHDPRYLKFRFHFNPSYNSYLWTLAAEQGAAIARDKDSGLSCRKLTLMDSIPDDQPARSFWWEEYYYQLSMEAYNSEVTAYERLKHLQGSVIPRLLMTGQFSPLDERAIQPPALVLEYVPSTSLYDISVNAITSAIRAPLLSAIESFPSHGIIHNDLTLTNIRFTPPEKPVRAIVIDFGFALVRGDDYDEEEWWRRGASDTEWARRLLEEPEVIRKQVEVDRIDRFM